MDAVLRSDGDHGDTYPPVTAITYGKLIEKKRTHITIAHEEFIDADMLGDLRSITTIPRAMVEEVDVLVPRAP
jgi:hypothetical protein